MTLQQMLQAHPMAGGFEDSLNAIQACIECSAICKSCADACLGEPQIDPLVRCIGLNLGCVAVCEATADILIRRMGFDWNLARSQVEACAEACRICKLECEMHAGMHEHCRICAEVCARCEDACRALTRGAVR